MNAAPQGLDTTLQVDLLVVGSGAGGLAAAITAAREHNGLRVLVIDKAEVLGGSTAWSGGWMWMPGHTHGRPGLDPAADRNDAWKHLRRVLGLPRFRQCATRIGVYLREGPAALDFFEREFLAADPGAKPPLLEPDLLTPDFHARQGAGPPAGRMVRAAALDLTPAQRCSPTLRRLRPPLAALTLWGMGIESGADLGHFLKASRPCYLRSSLYVLRRVLIHFGQWLVHGRGLHLVNGHALAARLLLAAEANLGADSLRTGTCLQRLLREGGRADGRITGALLRCGEQAVEVRAALGVVLACGGFSHDHQRLAALMPHALTGRGHHSAAPTSNTGDGLNLAEAVGASLQPDVEAAVGWCPVSLLPDATAPRGYVAYPHFVDRAKPGAMAVLGSGQRACNEAGPYPDVVSAWLQLAPGHPPPLWLIADGVFLWRYGLGAIKPTGLFSWKLFFNGYATLRWSLRGLARACGIDAEGLLQTVHDHNLRVAAGTGASLPDAWPLDPDFRRGQSPFDRSQGEAEQRPHPCMAPIRFGPYVAIRLWPGSLGTFAGLRTTARGEVLDQKDAVIPGLYACGNDMASPFGGHYVNSGITLGAALIFGHVIGKAVAAEARRAAPDLPH